MTMKLVKAFFSVGMVLSAIFATATTTRADRLYLSTVGPEGSPIGDTTSLPAVPTVMINTAGGTGTLHVWMQPDVRLLPSQPAPAKKIIGFGYDIETSNTAVANATGSVVVNPNTLDPDSGEPTGPLRWSGVDDGYPAASGGSLWVENALASGVGTPGMGNGTTALMNDGMKDMTSRSYYLGSITFTAVATGRTGLYFRVGDAGTVVDPDIPAPLQFGNSTTTHLGNAFGTGDPITADLAEADAIIDVMIEGGGGDAMATLTPHALGDLTPGVALLDASPKGTFVDVNPNVSAGRININNFHGENSGNLTVFFDLVNNSQAAQLVTDLNAQVGRAFTASLSSFVGTNPSGRNEGDVALTFAGRGTPGSSQFIDFDFGAGVMVQAVGIPEPSTYALAGMALLATAVYSRRRRAA
jgi:hypothetical protein